MISYETMAYLHMRTLQIHVKSSSLASFA